MSTFRNGLVLSVLATAFVLASSPKEEETKPAPPPTKTDVARIVHVAAQTLPQRLRRSPDDVRRFACGVASNSSDKAQTRTACHNYPYLALGKYILPLA